LLQQQKRGRFAKVQPSNDLGRRAHERGEASLLTPWAILQGLVTERAKLTLKKENF